ncbi:MAG: nucleotidyltransferase domain-containing protein [Sphingorhabdus sp.]
MDIKPSQPQQFLRTIPDYFDVQAVNEIDRRLSAIADTHNVTVVWAIESGSRAWGFPSPDSDYDGRFIYARSIDQYLSPWQPRDVIEMPIEDDMDVNGWDLGKAIKLMLKGNAVVVEWLQSPIVYHGDVQFRDEMLELADICADRVSSMRHYYHLGTQQWQRFLTMGAEAPAKKLFYAARPALCLRWLRLHGEKNVPPMHFQTLLRDADAPASIAEDFEKLVAEKAETRELGKTAIPCHVRDFIDGEYVQVEPLLSGSVRKQSPENVERARALFHRTIIRCSSN